MSRLMQTAGWVWKPVAALGLALLLAAGADAAPPPAGGTVTAAGTTTGDTTATPADGPIAEIVALAQFLADELDLTFADPVEEMFFFFAVADLYFQVQWQATRRAGGVGGTVSGSAGGTRGGRSGTTAAKPTATLGSLTTASR